MDIHMNDDLNILLDSIYVKEDSNLKIATGIEGYLNFCEQIEISYGGTPWTDERKQKHRQELIDSGKTIFIL